MAARPMIEVETRPLISILHPTARVVPSAAFPRGWRDAHAAWLERADHPERIEYILTVHSSRWEACNDQEVADYKREHPEDYDQYGKVPPMIVPERGWFGFQRVKNDLRDCTVDQLNLAAQVSTGKLLVSVMDDYFPPEHWDTLLLEALPVVPVQRTVRDVRYGIHPDHDGLPDLDAPCVILCSTGATPERDLELMIGSVWTRKAYELYGNILDPDFESMFSDNWNGFRIRRDEALGLVKVIERLDIQFDHRHPIFGKGQMDDVYRLQNREIAYRQGAAIFHQKVTGAKVIVICLPGESFRNEWVGTTFQMVQQLGSMGYITAPHWCYTSNVYCTRIELAQGALEFRPKADYVLWVDDDNLVTAEQVQMLVEDLESHPELGGVVGWCWCDHNESEGVIAQTWRMSVGRQSWPDLKCLRLSAEDLQAAFGKSPLITSEDMQPHAFWSGFPCVLMRRSALEQLGPRAFAPLILDVNYGFTGEDTSFFINVHKAGIKFAVDIRVKVPHVKWRAIEPAFVPGRPEKVLQVPSEVSSAAD